MSRSPLERALGVGSFLTLRGKKYQCSPLRLRHFAEAKAFLVSLAPDPLKELLEDAETFDGFSPEVQKALALKALELREERKSLASNETAHWINGPEGVLFFFWAMVRDHHPEFATIQSVFEAFPLDVKDKELTIAEADLLRKQIDLLCFGGNPDILKKKKK